MPCTDGRSPVPCGPARRPSFLPRSAALSVVALAIGIVSGGAVRLTGSGLGCSDWPACTSTSIVAPLRYHAWVEFGNRLVNVAITVGIVLVVLAALQRRPRRPGPDRFGVRPGCGHLR